MLKSYLNEKVKTLKYVEKKFMMVFQILGVFENHCV